MEKENSLPLSNCEQCNGIGLVKNSKCKNCRGLGAVLLRRGKVLYWSHPISLFSLTLSRSRRIINKIRFFTALLLGINFYLWSFYYLYQSSSGLVSFQNIPTNVQLLFWLGSIFICYAWYRALTQKVQHGSVEAHEYKMEYGGPSIMDWPEILKINHRLRKNIYEAFTDEAISIFEKAYLFADKQGSSNLKPTHLFFALLESNRIGNTFIRLGISPKSIESELKSRGIAEPEKRPKNGPVIGQDILRILFASYEDAFSLHQEYVSVTELLTNTVKESNELKEVLFDLDIDDQKLRNVVQWARIKERLSREYAKLRGASRFRSTKGMDRAMTAVATPYLNRLSEDVTLRVQLGGSDLCVARDSEINEIFQVIEGGQHNVLLVGDYGVGKRSIIEGIAGKMIEGDVPKRLFDKRLVQLSLSSLLSGTTPAGAIERLAMSLNEIARAGNIILFIHNLHELLGVSTGEEQSVDVASTLAEYLNSDTFLVIATTTPEAYAKEVSNSKLSTVFTKVEVREMDENQAISVLESKTGYVEYKERVFFSYNAIAKAVDFSRRYLRDTPLPGSALELMTEAAVFTRSKKGLDTLVTGEEVAAVVAEKTHIPLTSVSSNESEKLLHLEEEMHKRVVGQDEAVNLVAGALRRARAEIRSKNKPIANFLFLGPTGVGKTELAKTIAEVYFGGEQRMIRLDMSEYQDKSSIYRLIGEPGEKGSGILTEAVRRQPFALLLLDEIEKAEKDVLNLFLQVMDDGRLTDSTGRVVDFTNVILVATSNAGTAYVQEQLRQGVGQEIIEDQLLHGGLKEYYRPEFLNRFDGIVLFRPLEKNGVKKITSLLLQRIAKDLEAKGIRLLVKDGALEILSEVGFDPEFGARPLRRVLQERIENQLAELLLSGKLKRRATVIVNDEGKLEVN